jgi:hypothetical protein
MVIMSGRLVHATVRALDWVANKTLGPDASSAHQRTGRRGEEDAYFYLEKSRLCNGGPQLPLSAT